MGRGFVWTPQKRQAVDLSMQYGISQREIAGRLGVTLRTLEGWLRRPAVQLEIQTRRDARRAAFDAHFQAQLAREQRASERKVAEAEANAEAKAQVWIAWKLACHQARAAHRKLPPEPPGLD